MKLFNHTEITLRFFLKSLSQQTDFLLISIVQDILSGQDDAQAKALQTLEEMTKSSLGNGNAHFLLGFCYEWTIGIAKDFTKALECYDTAQSKNLYAQWRIGMLHEYGKGVEKNEKVAFEWYEKAAAQGLAEAQCSLGNTYENGLGVEKDLKKAFELYRQSAEKGLASAQNTLGTCYAKGLGVTRDLEEAFKWFQEAAKQEYGPAECNFGFLHEAGKKDQKTAFEWYQKAANHFNDQGQKNLDRMYQRLEQETGKKNDLEWYKRAASDGYSFAQCLLGVTYAEGLSGIEKNVQIAQQHFKEAKQRGNNAASSILSLYEEYPDFPYQNMPLLWQVVYVNPQINCNILPMLFRITIDKLTVSPSEGDLKDITILSMLISDTDSNSAVILQLLEILKNYSLEDRRLDAFVVNKGAMKEWTALHFAASDERFQIVEKLLNLGASLDKGPEFNSILTHIEHLKTREILQAANDVFTLVESGSAETKRSAETKEKDEAIFAKKLEAALKKLGTGLNARKKGLTALEVAMKNGQSRAVEILLEHRAEFPKAQDSDLPIVKAFRKVIEINEKTKTFQAQSTMYKDEDKAKEKDEEKLKKLQEKLTEEGKEMLTLGNDILDLSNNLEEPSRSRTCYKLGILLHNCQPHFNEMVFESLSQVVQGKVTDEEFEKANFILLHLKLESEKTSAKDIKNKQRDILSFAIKAGNQLPLTNLAHHLNTALGHKEFTNKPLGLSFNASTRRSDVLLAAFRQAIKQLPDKKGAGGTNKLGLS